jgi:hypothetical protein
MDDLSKEIARRALQLALSKLDSAQPGAADEGVPVVVVVVAPEAHGARRENLAAALTASAKPVDAVAGRQHPGLDKFPLAETSAPTSGMKTCFMEPERPCVNSGACELRGY